MPNADRPCLRDRARRAARAVAPWIVMLAMGCATSRPEASTPEQTLVALSRALGEGKLEEAYALMSEDYRKRVSLETWKQQLGASSEEVLHMSGELARVRGPFVQQAIVRYGERDLVLQKDGDRWVIASDVAVFYDQSTPRAALYAFIRALTHKRYDVLLRLCPNADRQGTSAESMESAWSGRARDDIERMLSNLRAHQDDPIEVTGNRATMPYGDRMQVQLLREDGVWKIENPE